MNCELQTLAADFGIRSSSLQDSLNRRMPAETENEPLVRDMSKCVKCGRCVEVCQEVQTVRAINSSRRSAEYEICTPYGQALNDGPCIFCGQCAAVCPVGAIFEHDETAKVWAALNSKEHAVAAQIAPAVAQIMCGEFGLLPGTITTGMIITALDLMGFSIVKDAGNFADMTIGKESEELHKRIKNSGKLPMIS
jgi:NADH-quinone oxidoreductase subunit G/NADP-reducing hydrogenase subunit HndD